jgi:AraC-like DNA-binding protein
MAMTDLDSLSIPVNQPIKAQNAGLFVSRGQAAHPTRVIQSHELIFIKQGELDLWEEGQEFHLVAGQTLHLHPGRQHGSHQPMPPSLRFYWIHFELMPEPVGDLNCVASHYVSRIPIPQVATLPQPERLERLFRTFLEDQETGLLHPYAANLLATLMLLEVVQAQSGPAAQGDEANALATRANSYIRMNFDRPITASRVADALGYNTDYLGRIYHKLYGYTLTEAIHRRRIEKACEWLRDTNLTILEVAARCGFADGDYFRRVFRRVMQTSPGEYRDEASRVHINTH